ncbi:YndM family protein [Thermaerobacillus caldiproteolyticus]|uniref:YndM family protein n=1 Tax=Thermaerobacillus caldiproteolyticus TaxID=247480 RepID=UPI00188B0E89|nr:YndM family protein [Anoxybacillus caldiproteolyticus]QPA32858.1 YndM family protein [Anoxybacillus caldiproteolyticus]
MRHLIALLIKYVLLATIFLAILPLFFQVSSAELLFFSLLMTLITYTLGDVYMLPRFGNFSATVADFVLVFIAVWVGIGINRGELTTIWSAAFFSSLLVAIGEAVFHAYMDKNVLRHRDEQTNDQAVTTRELQTEMAEELDVRTAQNKDRHRG